MVTPCSYKDSGIASSNIFSNQTSLADFSWTSETNLVNQYKQKGLSENQIISIFENHRSSYVDIDKSFAKLSSQGIKLVRLPITWALTYPDHDYQIEKVSIPAAINTQIIQDPFYSDAYWVSIPIGKIESILQTANKYNIKVLVDIHAYPGGSGDGTYNGVWPKAPLFWTGNYQINFNTIFQNLVSWAEGLFLREDKSFAHGLAGLSPMNEPAHLLAFPDARCDGTKSWGITGYQPVLDTLAQAVVDFRNSSLPKNGVLLYVNIIEKMFSGNSYPIIGSWWNKTTAAAQQKQWAVLDIHYYAAWDPSCNSCLKDYVQNNTITQDGFDKIKTCSSWFLTIRQELGLNSDSLLS